MKHELWKEPDVGLTLCLSGPRGDQARAMLGPDARLEWTCEAKSFFEAMTLFYAHMGWGEYVCAFPEEDLRTYAELGWEE